MLELYEQLTQRCTGAWAAVNRKEKKTFPSPPFPFWKTSDFRCFTRLKHPHVMGESGSDREHRKGKGRYRADLSAQASTEADR